MTKKEKILQWLKDNGVFEKFCENSPKQEIHLNEFLLGENFAWGDSPEGYLFWKRINNKYIEWYYEQFPDEYIYVNFKEIDN